MSLGHRLRQARLEAGLTQDQVCGTRITRNQLSLLENDKSCPSVGTLQYLAGRLGKPAAWFLDETVPLEGVFSRWSAPIEALRALEAVPAGALRDLLEASLCLQAARQAAREARLPYARSLVDRAGAALDRCPLAHPALDRELALQRALWAGPKELESAGEALASQEGEALLCLAALRLGQGLPQQALHLLDEAPETARALELRGRALYALNRFLEAAQVLESIPETAAPEKQRELWTLLEDCYREAGDFQKAYACAVRLRQEP